VTKWLIDLTLLNKNSKAIKIEFKIYLIKMIYLFLRHALLVGLAQDVTRRRLVELADQDSRATFLQVFQVLKIDPGQIFGQKM
jgi:hypothetical protein